MRFIPILLSQLIFFSHLFVFATSLPNQDEHRQLHINIYLFEHTGGFVTSFILSVIAMQLPYLPQISNMELVFLIMCLSIAIMVVDFGNKWCVLHSLNNVVI